ncbi:NAD(P)-binding protein [Dentipellis sp. KUC8613]|nr:NAD(P)-binding protein [Dentipellis sp. KUC8613]
MSPVAAPAKVLVTGANGYVAVWVVRRLLEDGYSVRGTVRSAEKGTHLRELFKSYGDKLELVVVPDITKEGAFDEAVKGADIVEHTASPFQLEVDTADDLIAPAVKGTLSILESINKNAPSVKRVVVTGSVSAVFNAFVKSPSRLYDETDWNDSVIKAVEKDPKDTPPIFWYLASKTLGEKAAWEFMEKNKSAINFDLVVVLPTYVFGPALHEVKAPMQLNQSLREVYQYVLKTKDTLPAPEGVYACVDVRDCADIHVLSAKTPEAGSNRIIASGHGFYWRDISDIAASSKILDTDTIVGTTPGPVTNKLKASGLVKTDKAEKLLGFKWTSLEDTVKDTLASFKEKNFV